MKTLIIVLILLTVFNTCNVQAQESKPIGMFRDSLDKAMDISNWLLNKKGFLVFPTLITEPSVGYGALASAIYFHSAYSDKNGPPSMSGVIGGATQNGTWMGGIFHIGYWKHDKIRYMGALVRTNINIGFYGPGTLILPDNEPINLNMNAWVIAQQIKFRLAESNFFLGGRYIYYNTDNTFEVPIDLSEFDSVYSTSTLSEASAVLGFDSRNNVFSPTKGYFLELSATYSDNWMGGDGLYGRIGVKLIGYFPTSDRLVMGVRHESSYSLGDVPFYARPIVFLRGAPLMKYQDKNTTVMEAEIDWNVYKRWYLIGFTGFGNAFSDFESFNKGKSVGSIGTGFRYKIARKFGLKMGMDFAQSTDNFAFYIVLGCSWLR